MPTNNVYGNGMTTSHYMPLQRGDLLWDFSWSRPTVREMQAAGVKAVIRYLSTSQSGKVVTRAEVDGYHAAGIGVLLLFEATATDAFGGAVAGHHNGATAALQAKKMGYPAGLAIVAACDTDTVDPNKQAAVVAYMTAFREEVNAAGYALGFYGGSRLLWKVRDQVSLSIKANASSWSPANIVVHWDIRQLRTDPTGRYDPNYVIDPITVWLEHTEQKDDNMQPISKRVYDSRTVPEGRLAAGTPRFISIPAAEKATAVQVNLTAINPTAGGYLYGGIVKDGTSLLNVEPQDHTRNATAIMAVQRDATGRPGVWVAVQNTGIDLVVDLQAIWT